ncbi:MAG: TonB-dependent receptor plug domain-containing protein, partial [Flavobacteriales bacterium]|nr:TonB-dependent receptor plug domain-containing protein [Flavobacteriales bacterium]
MYVHHHRRSALAATLLLVLIVIAPVESTRAHDSSGTDDPGSVNSISKMQLYSVADSVEVQIGKTVHSLAAAEVVEASSPASESFIPPVRMDAVQLDQIPASSRIAALAATAGVDMVSAGAGMLRPVMRGLSGLRIATLFNGARIESQAWGEYHGIYIPEEGIERVEIIRGPGTLAHGSDAYGGVLNFVPNQVLQERGRKSQVSLSGFSATSGWQATAATEKRSQSTFHSFRGGYKRHGDYRLPSGEALFNSAYTQFFAQGTFGYLKSWGSVEGAYSSSYNNADIIGHDGWSQSGDHLVTTSMRLQWGAWHVVPRISYQLNHRKEFDLESMEGGSPDDELSDEIALDMSLRTLRYDLKAERKTAGRWNWVLGSQGFTSSNTNEPEDTEGSAAPLIRDAVIQEISGFVIGAWKGEKIEVEASMRGDARQTQWNQG